MIDVHGIVKSFGRVRAVRGVGFRIPRGQVAGLLGANGAGKSTTLRVITGFLPPDAGSVRIDGRDIIDDSRRARRSIGYLPESAPAYAEMGSEDYLHFRGRLYGMDRRTRKAAVERVVARCGLGAVRRRRAGHLSKGFRQRLGLAAALLHDPPVLVLDEPTSGLDPAQIREFRGLIRELAREPDDPQGRTVLISSHILPEIEQTCDRVVIMAAGRVRADGPVDSLIQKEGGSGACLVEVKSGGGDGVLERTVGLLRQVGGVGEVEVAGGGPDNGWARLRVVAAANGTAPGAGVDLREPVAVALREAGVLVRELRLDAPSLERLFLRIMESEQTPGGGENR
jgi:ABC-2 type transport system ATP-binding protein